MEIKNNSNITSSYASQVTGGTTENVTGAQEAQKGTAALKNEVKNLFNSQSAELTNVQEYIGDNSNPQTREQPQNPLAYVTGGKSIEIAGNLLKKTGEAISGGATELDNKVESTDSKLVNNQFVGGSLGKASGALGFAGSTLEGVGGMSEWAGKMLQGDSKTLNDTGSSVKSFAESALYTQGKVNENIGNMMGASGEKLNISALQTFGHTLHSAGRNQQNSVSDGTKKKMDTYIATGKHLAGHIEESGGNALEWAGDGTDNKALSAMGKGANQEGKKTQADTENNVLVKTIDQAISDRGKEYSEHGDYAINRDVTRVVLEVGTAVISPEAVVGKASSAANVVDKAGDIAKIADTAGDIAKAADKAGDIAKAADTAFDANKAVSLHGPTMEKLFDKSLDPGKLVSMDAATLEKMFSTGADKATDITKAADTAADISRMADNASDFSRTTDTIGDTMKGNFKSSVTSSITNNADDTGNILGKTAAESRETVFNERIINDRKKIMADPMGGPDWTVYTKNDGKNFYSREIIDSKGKKWIESVEGKNHWKLRTGIHEEAVAKGQKALEFKNAEGMAQSIQIFGGATDDEIRMIQKVMDDLPEQARKNLKSIDVSKDLGSVVNDFKGNKGITSAFADKNTMTIDRAFLKTEQEAKETIYHELGHVLDKNMGKYSEAGVGPWGKGDFVSEYASRNAGEDFAEVHSAVIQDWDRLSKMPKESWLREAMAEKKAEILDIYGVKDPLNWLMAA